MLLRLFVGTDGVVTKSMVERSSGFSRLDNAADEALTRCQYEPGRVDGKPVAAWVQLKYTFKIAGRSDPDQQFMVAATVMTYLPKYIDRVASLCGSVDADTAEYLQSAAADWHVRNTAVLTKVDQLKQPYFSRMTAEGGTAADAAALERKIQWNADRLVQAFVDALGAESGSDQRDFCQQYATSMSSNGLDISKVAPDSYQFALAAKLDAP